MKDQQDELNQLHQKVVNGVATPAEKKQLVDWLAKLNVERPELSLKELNEEEQQSRTALKAQLINSNNFSEQQAQINKWWTSGWARVAVVLLLVGSVSFFLFQSKSGLNGEQHAKNIVPGSEKALLTLADGSVVSLSDVTVGTTVALDGGVRVEKTNEGNIVYHANTNTSSSATAHNKVTTPKGGHFKVTLPDGSMAWLNAASSISYPLQFAANERRIKMTGEVYFEIAQKEITGQFGKKKKLPFYVATDEQEIQVLGTHFNVNAYTDEPFTATTLIEGSVKVTALKTKQSVLLQPGQQAKIDKNIAVEDVETDQFVAWTSGDFIFRGEELGGVLRKIARWYDVEYDCSKELAELRFNGMVSRSQPLSTIIETLQSTKRIKVTLKERRITVTD